jgi:uncharacterized protein (DUF111 family)
VEFSKVDRSGIMRQSDGSDGPRASSQHLSDILKIIDGARLEEKSKPSIEIFTLLAKAEAKVHDVRSSDSFS